jgi:hypothetical protein
MCWKYVKWGKNRNIMFLAIQIGKMFNCFDWFEFGCNTNQWSHLMSNVGLVLIALFVKASQALKKKKKKKA